MWKISPEGNLESLGQPKWKCWKENFWNLPDEGKEGCIMMEKPDTRRRQKYFGKEKDGDKVDWTLCTKCPDGDNWKWERSIANKEGFFTLKNKSNGKILTAYGEYNTVVKGNGCIFYLLVSD